MDDLDPCPHCAARGKTRSLDPSTARTPRVARSDGRTFHVYLEELHDFRVPQAQMNNLAALFRYDLDDVAQAESTLVMIEREHVARVGLEPLLEQAADTLAAVLMRKSRPAGRYRLNEQGKLIGAGRSDP
jgi:hypothetical protein